MSDQNTVTAIIPCPDDHSVFHVRWRFICKAQDHTGAKVVELTKEHETENIYTNPTVWTVKRTGRRRWVSEWRDDE
jgi:hypothetical protein